MLYYFYLINLGVDFPDAARDILRNTITLNFITHGKNGWRPR